MQTVYHLGVYKEYIEKLYDIYNTYLTDTSEVILMGDFNWEIKAEKCKRSTPSRGPLLEQFMHDAGYTSVNSMSSCLGPEYTFDPLDNHTKTSLIDHIMLESTRLKWLSHCAVIDDTNNCSDHLPVHAVLEITTAVESHQI